MKQIGQFRGGQFMRVVLLAAGLAGLAGCQQVGSAGADDPAAAAAGVRKGPAPGTGEVAAQIMQWWTGDYNNAKQISALQLDGAPIWQRGVDGQSFGGHLPVTAYYRPITLPAFGANVLYLEEFTFGEDPYRQRIYTVIEDSANNQVRVKLWYFPDKTTYKGAWQDLSKVKELTPEMMSPLPDHCDLVVVPLADGRLDMRMPKDQCQFGSSLFDYQVVLGPDDFWFRDRIVNAETMVVKSTAGSFTYHKMDRVSR